MGKIVGFVPGKKTAAKANKAKTNKTPAKSAENKAEAAKETK